MVALSALFVPLPSTQQMHIPDGYLSPLTALVMFALVLPFWWRGAASLRQKMSARNVPLIALMAAFSFVIMMFNVPLPGGTTGHAVGGVLAAIVLGPDIAVVAISIALVIQAFFFGDGGILAIGANSFNMAVVLPFVGYAVYQLVAGRSAVSASRRAWAAGLAGYIGLTVSAFCTAVEFGIQPALFHTAAGAPLYAPYPLAVAIPAMVIPHMLVASVVEGALTAAVVVYLQRSNPAILQMAGRDGKRGFMAAAMAGSFRRTRALWTMLAALVIATPLGLLAPGTAWGEWNAEELAQRGLGFVPAGLAELGRLWGAPATGYQMPGVGNERLAYMLSAALGIGLAALVVWLLSAVLLAHAPAADHSSELQ
jgi:cobalt/nickel transport system permease protein